MRLHADHFTFGSRPGPVPPADRTTWRHRRERFQPANRTRSGVRRADASRENACRRPGIRRPGDQGRLRTEILILILLLLLLIFIILVVILILLLFGPTRSLHRTPRPQTPPRTRNASSGVRRHGRNPVRHPAHEMTVVGLARLLRSCQLSIACTQFFLADDSATPPLIVHITCIGYTLYPVNSRRPSDVSVIARGSRSPGKEPAGGLRGPVIADRGRLESLSNDENVRLESLTYDECVRLESLTYGESNHGDVSGQNRCQSP